MKKLEPKTRTKVEPTYKGKQGHSPKKATAIKKRKTIIGHHVKGLSASGIGRMMGLSQSYVSRIIRLEYSNNPELKMVLKKGQTLEPNASKLEPISKKLEPVYKSNVVNIHAQRVRCFVHYKGKVYDSHPNVHYENFVPGVDVQCQGGVIYLYSKGIQFSGESEEKALFNSLNFWKRVIVKLEDRLAVGILKPRTNSFEFVYYETETSDSVVARDADDRGVIWRVYHSEDGKLRLSVDHSNDGVNHETHHVRDGHVDSVVFNKHVNSILDNPSGPSYGELVKVVHSIALSNKDALDGLNVAAGLIKNLVPKRNVFKEDVSDIVIERPSYVG